MEFGFCLGSPYTLPVLLGGKISRFPVPVSNSQMVVAGGGLVAIAAAIFGEEIDMGTVDYALNLEEELILYQEQSEHHFSFKQKICCTSRNSANSKAESRFSNTFPFIQ